MDMATLEHSSRESSLLPWGLSKAYFLPFILIRRVNSSVLGIVINFLPYCVCSMLLDPYRKLPLLIIAVSKQWKDFGELSTHEITS